MNDIDILEELINEAKKAEVYEGNKYYKAMENLIKRNKELESIEQIHREENGKLQKKVTDYEEIDLTQVYISGVYDERDKWKNKIKEKKQTLETEGKKKIEKDGFISVADEAQMQLCDELLQEER